MYYLIFMVDFYGRLGFYMIFQFAFAQALALHLTLENQ